MQDDHDDTDTPGWDAINAALAPLYAGQEPLHFGTALPYTLGGQDPLDGISVYRAEAPVPHWHYITYGLSELYAKESSDAEASGYGFELTFRLAAGEGVHAEQAPPTWPMNLLQNLARYVFGSGNVFEDGHHLDANGPIALESDTRLRHLAFIADPQLPARETANGRLQFLQLVGLTDGEMAAVKRWSTRGVLHVLEPAMPLWITDLHRGDLLDDPALAAQVQAGSAREGSSTGMLFIETLDWRQVSGVTTLVLGAGQVPSVRELLPLRLHHGASLVLVSRERQWEFTPAAGGGANDVDADSARWALDAQGVQAWQDVRAERGIYPLGGQLQVEVVPTLLRDAKGAVIREIG
ncbi:suppressor of fused domain protein [Stenotrophomonas maltophilia]|uniref:suppressor of fused domain protein n=1 Tax=Stenotrophomonas TaxID=40323 RepID=UPI0007EF823F|nr:suppressor of fused domain protein [Stenotrophomonas maltophilia]MBH1837687.1 suppressor of fused domain protein [Stenotrophomonas maltophilia]MCO7398688.1 suppressor of fused domain protein [Stenotrophomonas maltophilia]MCO7412701.1 suppressor of fused domain protein [Stenotrophomonas maltophilia]OBU48313.1 aminotransferase [Stenotrophomonas maltophilia]HDS1651713.1 suppressor of fused domain protein [Stenotrophomonas maltophilia]